MNEVCIHTHICMIGLGHGWEKPAELANLNKLCLSQQIRKILLCKMEVSDYSTLAVGHFSRLRLWRHHCLPFSALSQFRLKLKWFGQAVKNTSQRFAWTKWIDKIWNAYQKFAQQRHPLACQLNRDGNEIASLFSGLFRPSNKRVTVILFVVMVVRFLPFNSIPTQNRYDDEMLSNATYTTKSIPFIAISKYECCLILPGGNWLWLPLMKRPRPFIIKGKLTQQKPSTLLLHSFTLVLHNSQKTSR